MARQAVVVTALLPVAEEVTDPLPVAVTEEAPCAADGHRLPRATKDLKARMTGGRRPLDRTVKALTAPTEHRLVRPPPPATRTNPCPTSHPTLTTPTATTFRGRSPLRPCQAWMTAHDRDKRWKWTPRRTVQVMRHVGLGNTISATATRMSLECWLCNKRGPRIGT